ncbi:MAG: efflux RND transporter periplasmic adaptor subunit [Gammaproteobacteria bacterium]|nr:efflux RND transporter periplasmic adaptor subunit [Gammaproteobacteria bacterium]
MSADRKVTCGQGAGGRGSRMVAVGLVLLASLLAGCSKQPTSEPASVAAKARKPLYYRNPMDPARTSPVPMKDEMGMDYVPVYAEAAGAEVRISPTVVNNLGVRTEPAVLGSLPRRADTVGYVGFDQHKVQQVRPRAEGWVEGLTVRSMGESVRAGQVLFTLYSPMLESAQQEYLDALKVGNRDLIEASKDRLRALGLDAGTAARIAKTGRPSGRVAYTAPISGVVTELELKEGSMVTPEMVALTITELGSLWVIAEVPEAQAGWVVAGTAAEMRFPSLPGERVTGHVEYVYPELDMETRTLEARIVLDRPPGAIRPNMLASVSLVGAGGPEIVNIPRSALIRSGTEDRVVVALGEGRFEPRRVVAGAESGERVAIREGLAAGENVVVAGQFLLDSEANLRAGLGRLGSESPPATTSPPKEAHD